MKNQTYRFYLGERNKYRVHNSTWVATWKHLREVIDKNSIDFPKTTFLISQSKGNISINKLDDVDKSIEYIEYLEKLISTIKEEEIYRK